MVGWEPAPGDDPGDPRVPPLAVLPPVVVLGDGAPWIWGLAAEGLRRERGYFAANAARTDSPAYRAAGLPVGSGAVESSAKQLVQARMERAGRRWSDPGAEALLALAEQLANDSPLPEVA